ncbi:MAG: hypothetical protein ACREFK_03790 [Stellaceae bacterium]
MKRSLALVPLLLAAASPAALATEPVATRVVVLLDTSGSFAKQSPAAASKIVQLLEDWSKQRLARGNRSRDDLSLIALDASPAVVYRATLGEIKRTGPAEWRDLIGARKGYAACTDVGAAFREAAEIFNRQPPAAANYLVVASDLINEPLDPRWLARGRLHCLRANGNPPADMPWQDLVRRHVTGFFTWLPTIQSIRWKKALEANGLGGAIHVLDDFESGVASLPAPKQPKPAPAKPLITPSEARGILAGAARTLVSALEYGGGFGVLLIGLAAGYQRLRRRRTTAVAPAPAQRPAAPAPRPVAGPVAPLDLARRRRG